MARRDLLPATPWPAKKHPHGGCRCTRPAKHNTLGLLMELFVPAKIKAHSLTGRITFGLVYDSFRAGLAADAPAGHVVQTQTRDRQLPPTQQEAGATWFIKPDEL